MELIRGVYSHVIWHLGYTNVVVDSRPGIIPLDRQNYNVDSKINVNDQFVIKCINKIVNLDSKYSDHDLINFVNEFGLIQEIDIRLGDKGQNDGSFIWSEPKPNMVDRHYPALLSSSTYIQSFAILEFIRNKRSNNIQNPLGNSIDQILKQSVVYEVKTLESGRIFLEACPINLLGAIWLFIMETLLSGGSFNECGYCGQWFVVKDGRGKNAITCSGACRTNRSRGNK